MNNSFQGKRHVIETIGKIVIIKSNNCEGLNSWTGSKKLKKIRYTFVYFLNIQKTMIKVIKYNKNKLKKGLKAKSKINKYKQKGSKRILRS